VYLGEGSWVDFASGAGYTVAALAGLIACLMLTAAPARRS
jgi:hypothetical protein